MKNTDPFLKNNSQVILLDTVCRRYGQRPSKVIGIKNELMSFDFDSAVMVKGLENEKEQMEEQLDDKTIKNKMPPPVNQQDKKAVKRRESEGFSSVLAMQSMVRGMRKGK